MSDTKIRPISDPTKVMWKRTCAHLIDFMFTWIISVVAFLAISERRNKLLGPLCANDDAPFLCVEAGDSVYYADGASAVGVSLVIVGYWTFTQMVLQGISGGTPGKLILGLRVIDKTTGNLAGFKKAAVRSIMWVIDAMPFLFPLVGLITGFSSSGHRRVGDMAAGTLVVHKSSVGTPPQVPGLTLTSSVPPNQAVTESQKATSLVLSDVVSTVPMATTDPMTSDGVQSPKWDNDRRAYIQWDPELRIWMMYNDSEARWEPIV